MATGYRYRCDTCRRESIAQPLRARYYVLVDGGHIPLSADLGWCGGCENVVAIEFLPELPMLLAHLKSLMNGRGEALSSERLEKSMQNAIREVSWRSHRRSDPRCLECGGTEIASLGWAGDRLVEAFPHAGCGGTLRLEDIVRLTQASWDRFSSEGLLIDRRTLPPS